MVLFCGFMGLACNVMWLNLRIIVS